MKYWWREHWPIIVFGGVVALILGLFVLGAIHDADRHNRLMKECLKDHKEYECEGMLKRNDTQVVPVPIIIPMR